MKHINKIFVIVIVVFVMTSSVTPVFGGSEENHMTIGVKGNYIYLEGCLHRVWYLDTDSLMEDASYFRVQMIKAQMKNPNITPVIRVDSSANMSAVEMAVETVKQILLYNDPEIIEKDMDADFTIALLAPK